MLLRNLFAISLRANEGGYIVKGTDGLYRFEQQHTEFREELHSILEAIRDFIKEQCEIL